MTNDSSTNDSLPIINFTFTIDSYAGSSVKLQTILKNNIYFN